MGVLVFIVFDLIIPFLGILAGLLAIQASAGEIADPLRFWLAVVATLGLTAITAHRLTLARKPVLEPS